MGTQRHILIVDGDRSAREALADSLSAGGFAVSHAGGAAEATALLLLRGAAVDMVLIDTALPDGDGRELVSRLRRRGLVLPLILISGLPSEDDVVWGLDAGADDYIVRPVRVRELHARIRAQFRAVNTHDDADIRIGPVVFRPASRTLLHPQMPCAVRLTEKEAALLLRLCRAEGRPVSRQSLLREVWGYSADAASHTVETHIYRLRRKIEPQSDSPALLINSSGGYRLCLDGAAGDLPAERHVAPGWTAGIAAPKLLAAAQAAG